jgi:predicted metal-dependent hydrolase
MAGCGCGQAPHWGRSVQQQRFLFDATPDDSCARPDVHASAVQANPDERDQPLVLPAAAPHVEFVRHPRARRYLIRVRVDGSVRVTIPRRGSRREATEFYNRQQAWILEQQQRVARLRHRAPEDLPEYAQRHLRVRARGELPARLLELAEPLGLTVRRVSVRNQRQRWGSCSPSGLICLNWRLITMPDWVRDYVLYHELMHLKRMDHSPAFWRLVAQVCPRYQEARRWLRQHALAPHAPAAHDDRNAASD